LTKFAYLYRLSHLASSSNFSQNNLFPENYVPFKDSKILSVLRFTVKSEERIPQTKLSYRKQKCRILKIKRCWHGSRAKDDFRDVTLACDGQQLSTHKLIISFKGASPEI